MVNEIAPSTVAPQVVGNTAEFQWKCHTNNVEAILERLVQYYKRAASTLQDIGFIVEGWEAGRMHAAYMTNITAYKVRTERSR